MEMQGEAVVSRVATDAGGGIKITLHVAEQTIDAFKDMLLLSGKRVQLAIVVIPD